MLCLTFETSLGRYAMDVRNIIEVVPLVALTPLPARQDCVAGIMNYRGLATPVIDLGVLLAAKPCLPLLSTRIIVVDYPLGQGRRRPLGLMAEQATETGKYADGDFSPLPLDLEGSPYLEAVKTGPEGMLTLIEPQRVLPQELKDILFRNLE